MANPAYCIPEAVALAQKEDYALELSTSYQLITDIGSYVPLTVAYSTVLTEDENKYYMDTMSSANPAQTAADYATYTQASAAMSSQTGALSTLIQSEKTAVSYETQSLKQQYNWANNMAQFTQIYCMLLTIKK